MGGTGAARWGLGVAGGGGEEEAGGWGRPAKMEIDSNIEGPAADRDLLLPGRPTMEK